VADADIAREGIRLEKATEAFVNAALFFADFHALAVDDGHAGAVVTAVFEPPQALDDDGSGGLPADVSDYAAHKELSVNLTIKAVFPAGRPMPLAL